MWTDRLSICLDKLYKNTDYTIIPYARLGLEHWLFYNTLTTKKKNAPLKNDVVQYSKFGGSKGGLGERSELGRKRGAGLGGR